VGARGLLDRGLPGRGVAVVSGCTTRRPDVELTEVAATPSPTAAPSPSPTVAPPRSFTLIGSGDVLLHSGLWAQAAADAAAAGQPGMDFRPLFAAVRPVVAGADLAICHLETPVATPDGPFSSYPTFNVPPQVVSALADLGYDSCSTASNHSLDKGEPGVVRTLAALDAAGIQHAGTARHPGERASVTLLRGPHGVRVAHLSYTYSFNGLPLPRRKPWLANPLVVSTILTDARSARIVGADVVVVSLHFGTEYQHAPNSYQITVAKALLASPDVDLILGHHAHVVQPLEKIGDKWVAYGMGNQVSFQNQSGDTRDGIMPRFTFTEDTDGRFVVTRVEVVPLHMWLSGSPVRLYDVAAALSSPGTPSGIRSACAASLQRTRSVLGMRGAYEDGLILVGG
jgi:poly-gamma-glutamate capsule biosynthesis protein CapA/YwtB (metallophosphatase superfamily)